LLISEKEIDALAVSGHNNFGSKNYRLSDCSAFSPAPSVSLAGFTKASPFAGLSTQIQASGCSRMVDLLHRTGPGRANTRNRDLIHESNAVPGKANRLTARMVQGSCSVSNALPFFQNRTPKSLAHQSAPSWCA
jgi:hypothetical protein